MTKLEEALLAENNQLRICLMKCEKVLRIYDYQTLHNHVRLLLEVKAKDIMRLKQPPIKDVLRKAME